MILKEKQKNFDERGYISQKKEAVTEFSTHLDLGIRG
jgi:hypothetical protein